MLDAYEVTLTEIDCSIDHSEKARCERLIRTIARHMPEGTVITSEISIKAERFLLQIALKNGSEFEFIEASGRTIRDAARDTAIDAGHLSRIFKGESSLSVRSALKLAAALEMGSQLSSQFVRLVAEEISATGAENRQSSYSVSILGLEHSRSKEMKEFIRLFEKDFRARFTTPQQASNDCQLSIQLFEIPKDQRSKPPAQE